MPAPDSPAAVRSTGRRDRRNPVVREFMTPRDALATLSPETTLREAAELLAARHVAGAPVLTGSEVVGVVSASDLMEFAATTPGTLVAEPGVDAWEDAEDDDEEASDARASFLAEAWLDAGENVAERVAGGGLAGSNVFEEHVVAEVMSTRLVSISPGAELRHAAELMRRAGVHRLLVLEDGRLVGLVTATDVMRAVAGGELPPLPRRP